MSDVRKIACEENCPPRSGSGFGLGLGLALELGQGGGNFSRGNFRRTSMNTFFAQCYSRVKASWIHHGAAIPVTPTKNRLV